jgi:5-(carboxyamino)imidazole ribonucleotide synthase
MVGGGQLARMTHQAAIPLGQSLAVLAESPDDAAALVCRDVHIGGPADRAALRAFAAHCDVLTFDHEHVPGDLLRELEADGVAVYPPSAALVYAQDKARMRQKLADLGAPVPAFRLCSAGEMRDVLPDFAQRHGWPVVVKTASGGYDGHGVWMVADAAEIPAIPAAVPVVLEERVPLVRELAAVVARSPFGQAAAWPVVETVQRDGICVDVVAPAQGLHPARATAAGRLALNLAAELGVVGVLAVELFEVPVSGATPDGLMVNELAMRPHNSGHWSQDGSVTSQFEQHLRAVLDYPLGSTTLTAPVTVMANVLGGAQDSPGAGIGMDERVPHLAARFPDVKGHLYGKSYRPGRKLGHVNVCGDDAAALQHRARLAAQWLGSGVWADGYRIHGGNDQGSNHHGGDALGGGYRAERRVMLRADGVTGARRDISEGQGRI